MALGKGLGSLIPNFKNTPLAQKGNLPSFVNSGVKSAVIKEGESKEGRLWHVPVSLIHANVFQPRRVFEHQDLED